MKRWSILLLLLLIPSIPAIGDDSVFYYDSLDISGSLHNPVSVQATSSSPILRSLTANISWFPRESEHQKILSLTTTPQALIHDEWLYYEVNSPIIADQSFDIDYTVRTQANYQPVYTAIPFPVRGLSPEVYEYLETTETIDLNSDIREKAASLAAGEDNLFFVVTNLAAWTKENIKYDLSTINSEASIPSTIVFERREGVCDEMTNLFISMCRSLGIPARFVSGLSYTNSPLFTKRWGAHGWAEVYFPGIGWVPFDVTYGQIGWVDATHIAFAEGVDSGKYASQFSWVGNGVSVAPQGMELNAEIIKKGSLSPTLLELELSSIERTVGSDSYNILVAEVSNPTQHYVADEVVLAQTTGIDILDQTHKVIAVAPGQTEQVYWRVHVTEELRKGYSYTFPILVVTQRNSSAQGEFYAERNAEVFSERWAEQFMERMDTDNQKPYSEQVEFSCLATPPNIRPGETLAIDCSLTNTGGVSLTAVEICCEFGCQRTAISAGSTSHVQFSGTFAEESLQTLSFTAKNAFIDAYYFMSIPVQGESRISIQHVSTPDSIDYSEQGILHFEIVQDSGKIARDLVVSLVGYGIENSWSFEQLDSTKSFDITVDGAVLYDVENPYVIRVEYTDDKGERKSLEETILILQGKISFFERILLWISKIIK